MRNCNSTIQRGGRFHQEFPRELRAKRIGPGQVLHRKRFSVREILGGRFASSNKGGEKNCRGEKRVGISTRNKWLGGRNQAFERFKKERTKGAEETLLKSTDRFGVSREKGK